MKKTEVYKQLERLFKAIARYQDTNRYFEFFYEYIVYLGNEKYIIPQIIEDLYFSKWLRPADLAYFHILFLSFTKHKKQPAFITKRILKSKYPKQLLKFLTTEREDFQQNSEIYTKQAKNSTKEDHVFDIEKLHIKLIERLNIAKPTKVTYNAGNLRIGSYTIKVSTDSNEGMLLEYLINGAKKHGMYLSYDQIAEYYKEDYDNKFMRKIYQACRRVNIKVAQGAGIRKFLKYDTKQVRLPHP
ncbi:MAG: hypothetical protein ABIA11_03925 [Patescibacteria group bacterium]|nr:hypothetical protein [Patescibacteria group bacterium]